MKKGKPISPSEAADQKRNNIPSEVIDIFNELIVAKFNGSIATVYQKDAVNLIVERLGVNREQVFDKNWLDVEDSFRQQGWKVEYDKPGYNENYDARYIFRSNERH